MPLAKVKGRQTSGIEVVSEGADVYIRAMRDGSLINVPWVMAKAIEGKVFCAMTGIMTGEDTFTSGGLTASKPDLLVNVPAGTAIIPVYIGINIEDAGATAAVVDFLAVASAVYDNVTAGDTLVIANMRTDKALGGSQCVATAVVSSGGTDPETAGNNYVEFWRPVSGFSEDAFGASTAEINNSISHSQWTIGDAVVPPVIVGEGSLNLYAASNAGKGFISVMWVEEPSANLI